MHQNESIFILKKKKEKHKTVGIFIFCSLLLLFKKSEKERQNVMKEKRFQRSRYEYRCRETVIIKTLKIFGGGSNP